MGQCGLVYDDENRLKQITYGGVTAPGVGMIPRPGGARPGPRPAGPRGWQGLRYRARLNGTYYRYVYNGDRRVARCTNDGVQCDGVL